MVTRVCRHREKSRPRCPWGRGSWALLVGVCASRQKERWLPHAQKLTSPLRLPPVPSSCPQGDCGLLVPLGPREGLEAPTPGNENRKGTRRAVLLKPLCCQAGPSLLSFLFLPLFSQRTDFFYDKFQC